MENMRDKDILDKIDEIIDLIKKDVMYKKYLTLKSEMEKSSEIMSKINEVKNLQKKIVKMKYNHEDTIIYDDKLNSILKDLDENVIYHEFINIQEEIDEVLQQIRFVIQNIIDQSIK